MSDPTSVIHDIGYRRYTGPRLGRGYAARTVFGHSLRSAFGIGRGLKAKLFPWAVAGVVLAIAAVIAAISSQAAERLVSYPEFVDNVGLLAMLFLAVVAPELVSRDLRARVLALYFSRPLRRSDYVAAKLLALFAAAWLLLAAPMLIIYAGAAFGASGPGQVWRETTALLAGLAYAGLYAAVTSALALLLASLTGRRAFAAGAIVAVFLVTIPVAGVLTVVGGAGPVSELAGLVNPGLLVMGVGAWLWGHEAFDVGGYGPVYGVAAVALVTTCTALLLARYRRVES